MKPVIFIALCSLQGAFAQLLPPNETGVTMGHLHLLVRDVAAQKKFWTEVMGGAPARLGPMEVIKFPGVLVILRQGDPAGGTKGSVVNHLGFKVPDMKAAAARMKAAGANFVTTTEVSSGAAKGDYYYNQRQSTYQAFIMGPDEVKIELSEDRAMTEPIAHHHVHWYTSAIDEMKAWYVKMFGARPGKRGQFEAADVPGVNLTFSAAPGAVAGTKGRSLDHVGFEIRNLEAFCKKLEQAGIHFDVPYRKLPNLGIAVAFFTDPWGTYIELTEGLDRL